MSLSRYAAKCRNHQEGTSIGFSLMSAPSRPYPSFMLIGKVIGDVVATQKHSSHEGLKILYVQLLNLDGSARGNPILAMDAADAGVGDQVLVTQEGWSAMTSIGRPFSPIDMSVIGVIDHVELE
jgi:ethanolamine utilization protein EutN